MPQSSKKKPMKATKIRFSQEETNKIQLLADLYAGGNFSKWVRYASVNAERKVLVK